MKHLWMYQSFSKVLRMGAHSFHRTVLAPRSAHEDARRREFILNVLLAASIAMLAILDLMVLYYTVAVRSSRGVPFGPFSFVLLFFLFLYILSRRGHFIGSSYTLLGAYFFTIGYGAFHYGVDLPPILLSYALLIVMASILISTRFGFLTTLAVGAYIIPLWYAQVAGRVSAAWYWKDEVRGPQVITFFVLLALIMIISWLSNREIERSLRRARRSEAELRNERNLLEVKVEERTKELKHVELEKMTQVYRFAELGRHAAGIFHELVNPLTAVALNIEALSKQVDSGEVRENLDRAMASARRMEKVIQALRKQIGERDVAVSFSLNEEIHQVMQLFEYKAKSLGVAVHFVRQHDVETYGNPLKFHQIVANLLSNALDAYDAPSLENARREVRIALSERQGIVELEFEDWGRGIPQELLPKIFDPFFTTKSLDRGSGIGLATVKHLVEKALSGTVRVTSAVDKGTKFTVEFAA